MGVCYSEGLAVTQNKIEAVEWFKKAAGQNYTRALICLGRCYIKGEGVPANYSQGIMLLQKAAEHGDADAKTMLDVAYAEVVPELQRKAEQGDSDAQFRLGIACEFGQGIPQSFPEAFKWYKQAAESGSADAGFALANLYSTGQGIPLSESQSLKWLLRTAQQGHARAQGMLGFMYSMGKGVPQDDIQAYKWLSLAKGQRDSMAEQARNVIIARMSQEDISNAEKQVKAFIPKKYSQVTNEIGSIDPHVFEAIKRNADNGSLGAQLYIGAFYYSEGNTKAAADWFLKSANKGHAPAQYILGVLSMTGNGMMKDGDAAFAWFTKSAQQGYGPAQYFLGLCYAEGAGTYRNSQQASNWAAQAARQGITNQEEASQVFLRTAFSQLLGSSEDQSPRATSEEQGRKAASQAADRRVVEWQKKRASEGSAASQYDLGMRYLSGDGVEKDEAKATFWLKSSAANGDRRASAKLEGLGVTRGTR